MKLQYPDMRSAVEADLVQLGILFPCIGGCGLQSRRPEVLKELGARLREELDHEREAAMTRLYALDLLRRCLCARAAGSRGSFDGPCADDDLARRPAPPRLRGPCARGAQPDCPRHVSRLVASVHYGVIHGDPHLGNYTVFEDGEGKAAEPARLRYADPACRSSFRA